MPNANDLDYAISTKGLTRDFGPVKAVDGIDLNVGRGEIYGFLGPNGAGKTTVIRMLVTLLAPTAGEITVAGFDAVRDPQEVRLRIGAALQRRPWMPSRQAGNCCVFRAGCTGCPGATWMGASPNCPA